MPAEQLSRTIELARITLIAGLVFLHYRGYPNGTLSPFRGFDPAQHQLATFVNSFVLFFFFSAVPVLSAISGWLFFGFRENAAAHLRRRIRGRITSLYAPLVAWNAAYLIGALALYAAGKGGAVLDELNIRFDGAGALDYVNAVFGLTDHPIAFQFWFVRDLFLTVLISPVLWLALRYAPFAGAVFLGIVWLIGEDLGIFFRTDVTFFFYLGALARMRGLTLRVSFSCTLALLALYVLLVATRTLAPLMVDQAVPEEAALLSTATRAMRLVGVVACWGLCLRLSETQLGAKVARYGSFAFFLFALHFPLIAVVKQVLWHLMPEETDGWMLAHYAASVAVTLALCLAAARLLWLTAPRLYAFLAGGRQLGVDGRRERGLTPALSLNSR